MPTNNNNQGKASLKKSSAKRDADGAFKSAVVSPQQSSPTEPPSRGRRAKTEIVRLNVGGTRYEASRDTLMRYEGSMLASLISGKWKEGDGDGESEIFIDRDGRRFGYILEYLRSDRVYLPDLSYQLALKDEFDYFGIDADMSKVSVVDDFLSIDELAKEIKEHEAFIEQKKKKIAAMKESYNLVGRFACNVDQLGPYLQMVVDKDVDKELLRGCLLARGLHVVQYNSTDPDKHTVNICVIGMKDKYTPKTSE